MNIQEFNSNYNGNYIVKIDGTNDVWVYKNHLDAVKDIYGHSAECVTLDDEVLRELPDEGYIGEGAHAVDLCEDLDDLLIVLKAITNDSYDLSSLPTFGGQEPADTYGMWSWDEDRLLIGDGNDDLEIVDRKTLWDVYEAAFDDAADAPKSDLEEYVQKYAENALDLDITIEQAKKIVEAHFQGLETDNANNFYHAVQEPLEMEKV